MTNQARTTTTPLEAAAICLICFGWPILSSTVFMFYGSHASQGSQGSQHSVFSDAALLHLVFSEIFMSTLALVVLRARKFDITALYPTPTLSGAGIGALLYLSTCLVYYLVVAPIASTQPHQPIEQLMSEATVSLPMIVIVAMVNGAYEEIFLLGFLQRGLAGFSVSTAMGISILVRMLYHTYQGPVGALSIVCYGLIVSGYYARSKSLFAPVFAHILADILPFVLR